MIYYYRARASIRRLARIYVLRAYITRALARPVSGWRRLRRTLYTLSLLLILYISYYYEFMLYIVVVTSDKILFRIAREPVTLLRAGPANSAVIAGTPAANTAPQ